LADNPALRYGDLQAFDAAMIEMAKSRGILKKAPQCIFIDQHKQIILFERAGLIFAFNFSPNGSQAGYWVQVPREGNYRVILSTDEGRFGGWDRVSKETRYRATVQPDGQTRLQIYLPARTALVLKRGR
jgi:1,4-alpha-glucan branching enzyme